MIIVFDLDGTLYDSIFVHCKSWVEAFKRYGYSITEEFVLETLGMRGKEIIEKAIGKYDERILDLKWELFLGKHFNEVKLYEDVLNNLKKLKEENKLVLWSSSSKEVINKLLERDSIKSLFSLILGAEDTKKSKPDSEGLRIISEKFNANPEEILFVGDALYDFLSAKNFGSYFAYIIRNHNFYRKGIQEQILEYDKGYLIGNFNQIKRLIKIIEK